MPGRGKNRESGNIFFMLFGAVALVGVIGAATMTLVRGPLSTVSAVNQRAKADSQLAIASKLATIAAAQQPLNGNCDAGVGDTFIEPVPATVATPAPAGGGQLPTSFGASQVDPWGTPYGYCVWDLGQAVGDAACDDGDATTAPYLTGGNSGAQPVFVVMSAGPNRTFETQCNSWDNVSNPPAAQMIVKPASSDDVLAALTYEEAQNAADGLWSIKTGDPGTITTDKNVEFASGSTATFQGTAQFAPNSRLDLGGVGGAGLFLLPNETELGNGECDSAADFANNGALRINLSSGFTVLEMCDTAVPGFVALGGAGATVSAIDDLSDAASAAAAQKYLFLGEGAGLNFNSASGFNNIGIGINAASTLVGGSGNIVIGNDADTNLATTTDSIVIGNGVTATGSNTMKIGEFLYGSSVYSSSGGMLGIGAVPSVTLDVAGTAEASRFQLDSSTYMDDSSGSLILGAGGSTRVTIENAGNVGIGVADPNVALDVSGDAEISGDAFADQFVSTASGNAGAPNFTFNTATNAGLYYQSSGIGFSIGGLNEMTLTSSGLTVDGFGDFGGYVEGDNFHFTGATNSGLFYSSGTGVSIDVGGVAAIFAETSGDVGIGDSSPDVKLDVAGAIRPGDTAAVCDASIYGAIRYASGDVLEMCSSSNAWVIIGTSSGGGSGFGSLWTNNTSYITRGNFNVINIGAALPAGLAGAGARAFWYPDKWSFRAGAVSGTQWDEANIGNYSAAFGLDNTASGAYAFSAGRLNTASNAQSIALGYGVTSSGDSSLASGSLTSATGNYSTAMGLKATASGLRSFAFGLGDPAANPVVSGAGSFGIFMGDQSGVNISTANLMALMGGKLIIDPDTTSAANTVPSGSLTVDVEGGVGAMQYCDQNGANCFTALDISGGVVGAPGNDRELLFNSGGDLWTDVNLVFNSAGRLGIGTSNPQVTLDLAATDALIIPHGTTAERPTTGAAGMLRYNSSTSIDSIEYYDAQTSTWQRIATATDATTAAGSDTQVQFNSGGSFGADADYTWNMTTNVLTIANSGTGAVRAGNGAVGAPSLSFTADPNTGLYNIAADTIGFATNGAEVARMTTGQIGLVAGTVGAPAYSFTGDLNTGLYNVGADAIGVAANGVNYMTVQAPGAANASVIFGGSAAVTLPSGATATRPSTGVNGMIRYNTDNGKFEAYQGGLWQDILTSGGGAITAAGANTQIQFNSGGVLGADADYTWDMTNNVLTIANSGTGAVRAGNGAVGAPSLSFTADPNTGLYNTAADTIGFATNGAEVARMTTGQIGLVAGAVGAPAYSFTGDLNTGLYNVGADAIGVAANGINYLTIQAPGAANAAAVFGGTSAITLPSGTTAERPSAGTAGMLRYNSSTSIDSVEYYDAQTSTWQRLATATDATTAAGANTQVQFNSGGVFGADADYTWDITNNVLTIANSGTGAVRAGNGAVGAPSLSFTADPNTGLYNVGADAIGVAANGVNYMTVQAPSTTSASVIFGGSAAVTLPSGATATRPSAGVNGMIRYNTDNGKFEAYQAGAWQDILTASAGGAISSLSNATATNTIANANYTQTWNWDTLTTGNALVLGSTSVTSGNIFYVSSSNAAMSGSAISAEINSTTNNAAAVKGVATGASGRTYGVYGTTSSDATGAAGVYGWATGASAATYGGNFGTSSTGGIAVSGVASAASGATMGGFFRTDSNGSAYGVYGEAAAGTGPTMGGYFESASTSGTGVYGRSSASSGTTYGVYGVSGSASGYAGYFDNTNAGGGWGVYSADDIGLASGKYLNWGATRGTTGYGIRDNAGVIECKNSGGSWAACAGWAAGANTQVQFNSGGSLGADADYTWDMTNNVLTIANSGTGAVRVGNGAVGAPSLSFTGDTNTGLYNVGADAIGVAANGVNYMTVQAPSTTNASVIFGGSAAVTLPSGATAARPSTGVNGMIRYNTDNGKFEAYQAGAWQDILTGSAAASAPDRGIQFNSGGAFTASSNLVYTSAGDLGVGIGVPTSRLHVVGTGNITGAATLGDTLNVYKTAIIGSNGVYSPTPAAVLYLIGENPQMPVTGNAYGIILDTTNKSGAGNANVFKGADMTISRSVSSGTQTGMISGADFKVNATTTGTGSFNDIYGVRALPTINKTSTGTINGVYGVWSVPSITSPGTGAIANVFGLYGGVSTITAATAITNAYSMFAESPTSGGAVITNSYGLYVQTNSTGTNRYAIYAGGPKSYFGGNVGIGSATSPAVSLEIGGTDAVLLPVGTTAQRPGSAVDGMIRYNSSTSKFEGYQGGLWTDIITAGASAAAPDRGIQFNSGSAFTASSDLVYSSAGSLMVSGTHTGAGAPPATGAGTRMFFDPTKSAFRAGRVTGTTWDNANIGAYSFATGLNTKANGLNSTAMGSSSTASGDTSVAIGNVATASGGFSVAIGDNPVASGVSSVALGLGTTASGNSSTAMGESTIANGVASTAMGFGSNAGGNYSTAMGTNTSAGGIASTAAGYQANANGDYSAVFGNQLNISATGDGSAGFGLTTTSPATDPIISGAQSFGVFMGNHSGVNFAAANTAGFFGGKMVIDPAVPATQLTARGVLDLGAATDALVVPIGTTAQRPGTAVDGMLRYNSSTSKFEGYQGGLWTDIITAGASAAAPDRGIQFNSGGAFTASSNFQYMADGDLLLSGTYTGTASVPATGAGTRMFFDAQKAAFRAGYVSGTQWDNASIGNYSMAMGESTTASGWASTATGSSTTASGTVSTAMGNATTASGNYSTAMGSATIASGTGGTAMGMGTTASGLGSTAMGRYITAGNGTAGSGLGDGSVALGLIDDAVVIGVTSQVTGIQSMGIFMGDQDGLVMSANNTMGLFGGKMVIDPAVPATQLTARGVIDVGAATDAIVFPSGTTAQRPGTAVNGMIRYNSSNGKFEAYQAGAWQDIITNGAGGIALNDLVDASTDYAVKGSVYIGEGAIAAGSSGTSNVSVGSYAFTNNTGNNNTVVGANAFRGTGVGADNTAIGYNVMTSTTNGLNNTAIGSLAMLDNTVGNQNAALGMEALKSNVGGGNSTAIGHWAMRYANSAAGSFTTYNTAVGAFALRGSATPASNTGTYNTAIGYGAMIANTSGTTNTAVGSMALDANTTGDANLAVGYNALGANQTGGFNTAVGVHSLANGTATSQSTAVGYQALESNTGSDVTGVGYNALAVNTAANMTAVGSRALDSNTSGLRNTAVGWAALTANVTSADSTAVGYAALAASTAANNTAIGSNAGDVLITANNTAIGANALGTTAGADSTGVGYNALLLATGAQNTALGSGAGDNITSGAANIIIGYNVDAVSATGSNQLNIGDTIYGDMASDLIRIGGSGAVSAFSDLELAGNLALKVSSGTTAQRPGTPANGMIRYNTDSGKFEGYQAGAWQDILTGSASAAAPDRGIQFNSGGNFAAVDTFLYTSAGNFIVGSTQTGDTGNAVHDSRMFFDKAKSAFRAGTVTGTEWDNASVGSYSFAVGGPNINQVTASGTYSIAMGGGATASNTGSIAMGTTSVSSASDSIAIGSTTLASNVGAAAIGYNVTASGNTSTALGYLSVASGSQALAAGRQTTASGERSVALGSSVIAGNGTSGSGQGDGSMALGLIDNAVTITTRSQVTGIQSYGIFMGDQDGLVMSAANTMGLFGGKMVIDPAVPATQLTARSVLDLGAATDSVVLPSGTTAQRPAAVNGMIRYNSETSKFEGYQGGLWTDIITAGGTAAAPDRGIQFNSGGAFTASSNLVYTSAGNLGIGTSSPQGQLHIDGGTVDAKLYISSDSTNTDDTDNPYLIFRQDGGRNEAAIWVGDTSPAYDANTLNISASDNGNASGIVFRTGTVADGFETAPVRMRITSGGNVGIGSFTASDPTVNLDVMGTIKFSSSMIMGSNSGIGTPLSASPALNDLSDVVISTAANGECLTYNGTNWVDGSCGGGSSTFLALTDTPAAYTSAGGMFVKVNAGATALEFTNTLVNSVTGAAAPTGMVIDDLDDVSAAAPSNGNVLSYNGTSWVASAPVAGSPAGANTQVQFNSGGAFGAAAYFTWDNAQGLLGIGSGSAGNADRLDMNGNHIREVDDLKFNGGPNEISFLMMPNEVNWRLSVTDGTNADAEVFTVMDGGFVGINNNGPNAALDVTGNIEFTGTLRDVSDMRLKTDIHPLRDRGSMLGKLEQIGTYSFRMKDDKDGQVEFGVMAQEINKVFPELVAVDETSAEKYMSVNYLGLIAPLLEASKELKAENDNLKTKLSDMEERMASIETDMRGMKAHTGYGIGKAQMGLGMIAGMLMMASLGGVILLISYRRRKAG